MPRRGEGSRRAWLPAGFAALRLCIPRITITALYDPVSAPQALAGAPELLCRLFAATPDSYLKHRVFMPATGGLIVGAARWFARGWLSAARCA